MPLERVLVPTHHHFHILLQPWNNTVKQRTLINQKRVLLFLLNQDICENIKMCGLCLS